MKTMKTTSAIRRAGACAIAMMVAFTSLAAPVGGHPGHGDAESLSRAERKVIREATRQFRDIDVAEAAGYVPGGGCVADPDLGGMGIHYVHPGLIRDGRIDPALPEILVYEPTRRGLRLVAIEYFVADADQDLSTDDDRPTLFGQPFDGPMPGHDPEMPVHYDIHAWVFKHNPAGDLAAWNPRVRCPE